MCWCTAEPGPTRQACAAIGMVFDASVEAIPGGARLVVQTDVRAHGLAKLASPLLDWVMQRQRVQSLAAIKRTLEAKPARADPVP